VPEGGGARSDTAPRCHTASGPGGAGRGAWQRAHDSRTGGIDG